MFKCPKGTADLTGVEYNRLRYVTSVLETLFQEFGGRPLETPVFERTDVLLGKYGEEAETKLVYNLEDQGGERLSLRYDLTVPFVRYCTQNRVNKMRRYSIGKVYRRDQPSAGRYREFYQADFDILGESGNEVSDAVVLKVVTEGLKRLGIDDYTILYNYTGNLRAMLNDVPEDNFKNVCSTVDKLDKMAFDDLVDEFRSKGVTDVERLRELLSSDEIIDAVSSQANDKLLQVCSLWNVNRLKFAPYLARGLDYYNGLVFEVKLGSCASSIVSGGRYDGLIPNRTLIGVSFGVSRMLSLLPTLGARDETTERYYVTTLGDVSEMTKLEVVEWVRLNLGPVDFDADAKQRKLSKVLSSCDCDYVVIVAEEEWKERKLIVRDMKTKEQRIVSCG